MTFINRMMQLAFFFLVWLVINLHIKGHQTSLSHTHLKGRYQISVKLRLRCGQEVQFSLLLCGRLSSHCNYFLMDTINVKLERLCI